MNPTSETPQPQDNNPPLVHVVRPIEPAKPIVSEEARLRHERSKKLHPDLNLTEGEYVVRSVRRHPIGLVAPLVLGSIVITAVLIFMMSLSELAADDSTGLLSNPDILMLPGWLVIAVIAVAMATSAYVYVSNRFFLTNESVIQQIQYSLFSKHEQTVSLGNVEDASYTQKGILQLIFNYGDVRLSTEGDETTYHFSYVANPKEHIAVLNNAVESFKYGRPVGD